MSPAFLSSLFLLAVALGLAIAVVEGVLVAVAKHYFGIEKGVRDPEARRRFKSFQRQCRQSYALGAAVFSLQEFKEPPYSWLADFSAAVTPLQILLSVVAVFFAVAALQRLRNPFAN